MVSTTLVDTQISDGQKIIRQLDADRFPVDSALWFFDAEKEKWVLLIATPLVGSIGPKESYERFKQSLDKLPIEVSSPSLNVSLVKPQNEIIQLLKSVIRMEPEGKTVRFSGNVINGTFIEDALIYKLG